MKKCDHFKDLILTDYVDGELDKNSALSLEDHLLDCTDCRDFFKEIKAHALLPFRQVLPQAVPKVLWERVKQEIEAEEQGRDPLAEFLDKLKGLLVFPRLVPIFASMVLMFLAGSVTLNTMHLQSTQAKEQGEYLVSLLSPSDVAGQTDNNDGSTSIEHYFL